MQNHDYYGIAQAERRSRIFEQNASAYKYLLWFEMALMVLIGTICFNVYLDLPILRSILVSGAVVLLLFTHEYTQIVIWSGFSLIWGVICGLLTFYMFDDVLVSSVVGLLGVFTSFITHYSGWKYILDESSGLSGFLFD